MKKFDSGRPLDLICLGRIGIDLIAENAGVGLECVKTFTRYIGGTPGNIAIGARRLGLKTALITRVGKDPWGDYILKTFKKENINITHIKKDPKHLTGLVVIGRKPPDDFPQVFYRKDCADLYIKPNEIDVDFLKKSKSLLVTGTSLSNKNTRRIVYQAIRLANRAKTAIILDIDNRPVLWKFVHNDKGSEREIRNQKVTNVFNRILDKIDLMFGTPMEIQTVGNAGDIDHAVENIFRRSNPIIVSKLGKDGCRIYVRNSKPIDVMPFKTKIVNLLGSGDAFAAGFLRGWIRGKSLKTCGEYGNANSAVCITYQDCSTSLKSFKEMKEFISNNSKKSDKINPK